MIVEMQPGVGAFGGKEAFCRLPYRAQRQAETGSQPLPLGLAHRLAAVEQESEARQGQASLCQGQQAVCRGDQDCRIEPCQLRARFRNVPPQRQVGEGQAPAACIGIERIAGPQVQGQPLASQQGGGRKQAGKALPDVIGALSRIGKEQAARPAARPA